MRQLTALTLVFAASAAPTKESQPADTTCHNESIYNLDQYSSKANILAAKDGVIAPVGSNEDIKPHIGSTAKVVDLQGHSAIPGLIDSRMHILGGGIFLLNCNLNYKALDLEKVLEHMQCFIDDEPNKSDETWFEAVNLDYPTLVTRNGQPTTKQLDQLKTKRPIAVHSSDYHFIIAGGCSPGRVQASVWC